MMRSRSRRSDTESDSDIPGVPRIIGALSPGAMASSR